MNYRVTVSNYKDDKYYPKVVRAVNEILNIKYKKSSELLRCISINWSVI